MTSKLLAVITTTLLLSSGPRWGGWDVVGGIGLGHHRVGVDPGVGVVTRGVVDKDGNLNCLDTSD